MSEYTSFGHESEPDETIDTLRHLIEGIEEGTILESVDLTETFANAAADAAEAHGWTPEQVDHEINTIRLETR